MRRHRSTPLPMPPRSADEGDWEPWYPSWWWWALVVLFVATEVAILAAIAWLIIR